MTFDLQLDANVEIVVAIFFAVALVALVSVALLARALRRLNGTKLRLEELRERFAPVIDIERTVSRLQMEAAQLNSAIQKRREAWQVELERVGPEMEALNRELESLREEVEIQSFGFYEREFDFDDSEAYKFAIRETKDEQKDLVRSDRAAVCTTEWRVGNNLREGQKMIKRTLKLMLRAFNGECDAAMAKVTFDNATRMEERVGKALDAINKLGEPQHCYITREYLQSKLRELELTYEHAVKKQEEKEEQRAIRAQMREEERARKEIEKVQQEAEKEEARYSKALDKARAEMASAADSKRNALLAKIELLERQFEEAHDRKAKAIARAQLTRSGHVYVISNLGSFGENIFKIGMTRRLEPLDRVKELGDASVPFSFDVHAMVYSEDAPSLESLLQRRFSDRQVNLVNARKEFFAVTLEEIEAALREIDPEVEVIHTAIAEDFRQSEALRRKQRNEEEMKAAQVENAQLAAARSRIEELRAGWRAEPI